MFVPKGNASFFPVPQNSKNGNALNVLILGHDDFSLDEATALRAAIRLMGGCATICRYNGFVRAAEIRQMACSCSEALVAIGRFPQYEDTLFGIAQEHCSAVGIICLDVGADSLLRHSQKIRQRKIRFAIVRSPEDQRVAQLRWSMIPVFVAENFVESAHQIAMRFLDT